MRIRLIESTDRDEWLRLLEGLHPELSGADHLRSIDANLLGDSVKELIPSAVFAAARPDGRLAGFLELSVRDYAEGCTGRTPYVESWFVDGDVRGTGVGRALMEAAEQWARDHGYLELASDALVENGLSEAAHLALGFEVVERIVVFRKSLTP